MTPLPERIEEILLDMCMGCYMQDPDIWCLKTSKVYLVTTLAKLSRQYLKFSPTWGMELNGRYLTAKDGFHKIGSESSLSDILEENVEEKYYLSQERIDKMFSRVQKNKAAGRGFQPSTVDMAHGGQLKPMFDQTNRVYKTGGVSPTIPTASGGHHIPQVELDDSHQKNVNA